MIEDAPAAADHAGEAGTPGEASPRVRVRGEPLAQLPDDLYIPPDALEVFLEAFEGPLDLLLYLIRRQNLDIRDIPILQVTRQYMEYIALMQRMRLELAAEYLLMAAWLAEIKSRVLLPRPAPDDPEEEEDPRMALIQRLQEYERFKTAAETIDQLPRMGRDHMAGQARPTAQPPALALPVPTLRDLLGALQATLARAELRGAHEVKHEPLSIRERMGLILDRLRGVERMRFESLLDPSEGRDGVVVSTIAVLELCKSALISVEQHKPFAPIFLRPPANSQHATEPS
ncbi:MAG: ScpA family protein [Algiphilus sp.]|uniref:segregation and condensation protein A n=1 Tax=Algiphilus sp. TaxID=1872431 RepID=UPI0032EBA9CF